jgi:8-oxo-dGTP pyrophosphatase MutT (NUDIX family)/L-amino acid N-acyltransferase YncA
MGETGLRQHQHIGAYALVTCQDAVLLVKKARGPYLGQWDLPGGRIEPGESPLQALRREVQEETGLLLDTVDLAGVYSYRLDHSLASGQTEELHHLGIIFSTGVVAAEASAGPDGQDSLEAKWHPRDQIISLSLTPFAARRLQPGSFHSLGIRAIVKPREADIRGLIGLSAAFASEHDWCATIPIGQIRTQEQARQRLLGENVMSAVVAVDAQGEMAGYFGIYKYEEGYEASILIRPDFRRSGLGREMTDRAFSFLPRGLLVEAWVAEFNQASIAATPRLGFTMDRKLEDAGRVVTVFTRMS